MTDSGDERPGGQKPPGPLGDTFPEFIRYARNRKKKGPRQAPAPRPGPRRSKTTASQAAFAAATVVCFFVIFLAVRALIPAAGPVAGRSGKVRISEWIDLPRPNKMGEVPDNWGTLKFGTRLQDLPENSRAPYTGSDWFADVIYTPDRANPDAWLGLSFHKDRLYRIAVRYGGASGLPTGHYLGIATIAYGRHRGYEYPTLTARHVVTIFQTETRALKFDSVKTTDELNLCEVVLVDLEQAAVRELARARGGR